MEANPIRPNPPGLLQQAAKRQYVKNALLFTAALVAGAAYVALCSLFPVMAVGLPTVYGLMATSAAGLLYQMANLRALKRDFPAT